MNIVMRIIINSIIAFGLAYLLSGISIDSFWTAIILAVVLGLLNAFVKPLLIIITIPITIFTFGLFLFVINALIILLADGILDGFDVRNFWWALLFGLLFSILSALFTSTKKES